MAAGCTTAGCVGYLVIAVILGVIGAAFHANALLRIVALAVVGGGFYLLSWRPGWKWNQIDARGITVTRAKSLGTRTPGRG